jgi:hypothetical protein
MKALASAEIKRIASANGGKSPGRLVFEGKTGVVFFLSNLKRRNGLYNRDRRPCNSLED